MWAVYKKELKSYFLSPIGYIAIGIFLLAFSAIFLFTTIFVRGYDMGSLYFYIAILGLPIIIPVITMRMFSEERKNGTEQLLITSPRSITSIVFGKFFAATTIVIITLLFSLLYYVILCFFKAPNLVTTLVAMLGFLLLSMSAISLGMFISSLTEHQSIAAILNFGVLFLPIITSTFFGVEIPFINLAINYQKFPSGLVSIQEIVNLLAFMIMFILFTIIIMQRRKSVK